jgi:FkbM family methyltransferase
MKQLTSTRIRKRFILPGGLKFVADPFAHVGCQLQCLSAYEPETVATFEALVQPGMTVADIGANIGHHTLILANLVTSLGSVHSFEPYPDTFHELVDNVRRNGFDRVHCNNVALSSKAGSATLYIGSDEAVNSLERTKYYDERKLTVSTDTLDNYVEREQLSSLDLVKIDVEGAERLVLEGAAVTLKKFKPLLVVEFSEHSAAFGYSDAELFDVLKSLDYSLFRAGMNPLQPLERPVSGPEFYNVVAVPPAMLDRLARRGVITFEHSTFEPHLEMTVR